MPHNAKAMNSLFTYLKNRTMEDITKELNSATQYLRVMKRTGNHKEDCDNVLMHLANIEDLVNKLNIDDVSKSLECNHSRWWKLKNTIIGTICFKCRYK